MHKGTKFKKVHPNPYPSPNMIYDNEDVERFLRFYEKDQNITRCLRLAKIKGGHLQLNLLKKRFTWLGDRMKEITDMVVDDAEEFIIKKSKRNLGAAKTIILNHPEARRRGWGKGIVVSGRLTSFKDMAEGVKNDAE